NPARPDASLLRMQLRHAVVGTFRVSVQYRPSDLPERAAVDEHLLAVRGPAALDERAAFDALPAGNDVRSLDEHLGAWSRLHDGGRPGPLDGGESNGFTIGAGGDVERIAGLQVLHRVTEGAVRTALRALAGVLRRRVRRVYVAHRCVRAAAHHDRPAQHH